MSFRLSFVPTGDRSFRTLPRWAKVEFNRSFDLLTEDPTGVRSGLDAHQLFGYRNVWTLRIPPYRGVYAVDGQELVWVVFGPRESVYAQLHAMLPPVRQHVSKERVFRRWRPRPGSKGRRPLGPMGDHPAGTGLLPAGSMIPQFDGYANEEWTARYSRRAPHK
jgi:hypothetical protein